MSRLRLAACLAAVLVAAPGCSWIKRHLYEGFGRDGWQQPEAVVAALGIAPGDRVADLGAGGGYFTFRLAEAVGPGGRVYAVDVDPDMLAHVEARSAERGLEQVETVRADPDDPKLPEEGVDLVFTCNTYHHLRDRTAYFARLREHLRPGGRVAVVELLPRGLFQRIFPHATEPEAIEREMEAAGYRVAERHAFLERQSFLVFEPAEASP